MKNTLILTDEEATLIKSLLINFVEPNEKIKNELADNKKEIYDEIAMAAFYKISGTQLVNRYKFN